MSLDLRLRDPLGERRVAPDELPLSLGGEGAAIAVPGVDPGIVLGWIGIDEDGLYVEPPATIPEGGELRLDGRSLGDRARLESGDAISLGDAHVYVQATRDAVWLRVEHLEGNVTAAPLLTEEQQRGTTADAAPLAIRTAAFRPFTGTRTRTRSRAPGRWAIGAALAVLAFCVWFYATATQVRVIVDPGDAEAEVDFAGAWPELSYGENHLVRPGSYVLVAASEGFETTRMPLKVGSRNQRLSVKLQKLPGEVTIDTGGVSGTLVVDGKLVGPVPAAYQIAAGERTFVVRAPRYQELTARVEVTGGGEKQVWKAPLVPNFSPVTVESVPAGAHVAIDGRHVGSTPLTTTLDAGSYSISLTAEGYRPWESSIQVAANSPQRIGPVELGLPDGHVTVRSAPAQADVAIGGKYRGRTPLDVALAPGMEHEVVVTKAGYEPTRRVVPVRASERIALEVTLKPVLGEVTVRGEPEDAVLYVGGQARGPANQKLTLPATEVSLEVRREGYETFRTSVTPAPGFPRLVEYKLRTPQQAREAKYPSVVRTGAGGEIKLMPVGKYTMGSPRREPGRRANETQREVTLTRPFYLGVREVTNAEFRQFRPDHVSGVVNDRTLDQDDHPVVNVTWRDAAEFCNWLSAKDGLPAAYVQQGGELVAVSPLNTGYRLPTEAEWEWAARYDGRTATRRYPWGAALPVAPRSGNYADRTAVELLDVAIENYDDGFETTAPVGSFKPNELGLYDMGGNVAEWTNDYYTVYLDLASGPTVDPVGPAQGGSRVLRGSSWRTPSITELRLASRQNFEGKADYIGFRIARYAE